MATRYTPKYLLLIIILVVFTAIGCTEVEQMGGKFRRGEEIVLNEAVEGDLYLTGSNITVNGPVNGDLLVAGGNIVVNGEVKGDVYAAGGQIDLNGQVGGDVAVAGGEVRLDRGHIGGDARVAGGEVSISDSIGEDLLVGAGDISLGPDSTVNGDLVFGAGSITVGGTVSGDVVGSADSYTRSGTVRGRELVRLAERDQREPTSTATETVLDRVRTFAMLFMVGSLIVWFAPRPLDVLSTRLRARPLPSLGWGGLGCAGILVGLLLFTISWIILAAILGVLTLGGLVAAVITSGMLADMIIIAASILIASFVTWVVVGYTIAGLSRPSSGRPLDRLVTMGLGVLALVLLSSLPVLNVVTPILVFLAGLGVITRFLYDAIFRRSRGEPMVTVPESDS